MKLLSLSDLITQTNERIARAIEGAKEIPSGKIIRSYGAAVGVNFTDWIGKTIPHTRHPTAHYALVENLNLESVEDHATMLEDFVAACGQKIGYEDVQHAKFQIRAIRKLLADPISAGLSGVSILAALEITSAIFIPDLRERARVCGCCDFTYLDKHGTADIEHAKMLTTAVDEERRIGYADADLLTVQGFEAAGSLICQIYRQ